MKTCKKMSFVAIIVMGSLFFSSCSVAYRAHHPRHRWGYVEPLNNIQPISPTKAIAMLPVNAMVNVESINNTNK